MRNGGWSRVESKSIANDEQLSQKEERIIRPKRSAEAGHLRNEMDWGEE